MSEPGKNSVQHRKAAEAMVMVLAHLRAALRHENDLEWAAAIREQIEDCEILTKRLQYYAQESAK